MTPEIIDVFCTANAFLDNNIREFKISYTKNKLWIDLDNEADPRVKGLLKRMALDKTLYAKFDTDEITDPLLTYVWEVYHPHLIAMDIDFKDNNVHIVHEEFVLDYTPPIITFKRKHAKYMFNTMRYMRKTMELDQALWAKDD